MVAERVWLWQALHQLRMVQATAATFAAASLLILAAVLGSSLVLRCPVPMVSSLAPGISEYSVDEHFASNGAEPFHAYRLIHE